MTSSKDVLTAMMLFFLNYDKQRKNVITIGGVILAIGLIGNDTYGIYSNARYS